jgi:3-deoxy-manno-octulosonate cytidylyltransferase (CMP-KDO synthetase)
MSQPSEYIGIVPARYASSRFPGKPLADILGKPMFWHVCERARRCRALSRVVLATDDARIFEAARALEVPAVMTRSDHPSGTDRGFEAAGKLGVPPGAVVVNIQGDEPALDPAMLDELLAPFAAPQVEVATLARKITAAEAQRPDTVKVVFSRSGRALYFSRAPVPWAEDGHTRGCFGHVGLYAFRLEALRRFVGLAPSRLEKAERLEQLRLIENDIPIHVVVTRRRSQGVDRPSDLPAVTRLIAHSRSHACLSTDLDRSGGG